MKKVLSLSLILILCFCLCGTAFADSAPTFTQNWTLTGRTYANVSEKVNLSVSEDPDNPVSGTTLELSRENQTITIGYPSYTTPGIYKYSITQTAANSQGATYDDGTIGFEVLVSYNNSGGVYVEKTGLSLVEGAKKDSFENTFAFGDLTVTNQVTGNLGDPSATFPLTVTLHADKTVTTQITYKVNDGNDRTINPGVNGWTGDKEVQITGVSNNGTVHFYDLPAGITYTISEAGTNGYTVTASPASGTIAAGQTGAAIVTQTKEADINTGIKLDSVPYLVVLALVLLGFVLLFLRRRRREE